jgi:hypothetical protein
MESGRYPVSQPTQPQYESLASSQPETLYQSTGLISDLKHYRKIVATRLYTLFAHDT